MRSNPNRRLPGIAKIARRWSHVFLTALLSLAASCAAPQADSEPEEETAEAASAVVINPTYGGPAATNVTYVCTWVTGAEYCSGSATPVTSAAAAEPYLTKAAKNWGCTLTSTNPVVQATDEYGGWIPNYYKWYGKTSATGTNCGVAYWNGEKQAAYFMPAASTMANGASNNTNVALYNKWSALGKETGALGMPISNPVGFGWEGTTYQLFKYGVVTYRTGASSARYASTRTAQYGAIIPERKALVDKYLGYFGVSPSAGPALYGLTQDVTNTCDIVGNTGCAPAPAGDDTGDYLKFWDSYWGQVGYVVARTGWTNGYIVHTPLALTWDDTQIPPLYCPDGCTSWGTPWAASSLGFPLGDLTQVGTASNGQAMYHQLFEKGVILWQPANCATGESCPGAQGCTTYGTRSTNYKATLVNAEHTPPRATTAILDYCGPLAMGCTPSEWIPFTANGLGAAPGANKYQWSCSTAWAGWDTITFQYTRIENGVNVVQTSVLSQRMLERWLKSYTTDAALDVQTAINQNGIPDALAPHCMSKDTQDSACQFKQQNTFTYYVDAEQTSTAITVKNFYQSSTTNDPAFKAYPAAVSYEPTFAYTLTRDLRVPGGLGACVAPYDQDKDCLDDAAEKQLAYLAAPKIFMDEEENRSQSSQRWKRLEMYQVRPLTGDTSYHEFGAPDGGVAAKPVSSWANSAQNKWVTIRYIMAYPYQDAVADHVGDTEMIELRMVSQDLRTWKLYNAILTHHNTAHLYPGSSFVTVSNAYGNGPYMILLADQDQHGSWKGISTDTQRCAPTDVMTAVCEANLGFAGDIFACQNWTGDIFDCWPGSPGDGVTMSKGRWFAPDRNLGEPEAYTSAGWPTAPGSEGWSNASIDATDPAHVKLVYQTESGGTDFEALSMPTSIEYTQASAEPANASGTEYIYKQRKSCGWKCPVRNTTAHCNAVHAQNPNQVCVVGDCQSAPVDEVFDNTNCDFGCFKFDVTGDSISPFGLYPLQPDWCYNLWGAPNRRAFTK